MAALGARWRRAEEEAGEAETRRSEWRPTTAGGAGEVGAEEEGAARGESPRVR